MQASEGGLHPALNVSPVIESEADSVQYSFGAMLMKLSLVLVLDATSEACHAQSMQISNELLHGSECPFPWRHHRLIMPGVLSP